MVWHEALLFKLNQSDISGNLLKLLRDFFLIENNE